MTMKVQTALCFVMVASALLGYTSSTVPSMVTMFANVNWNGGLDNCTCNGGDSYACSSGVGAGDWEDGMKFFHDSQQSQSLALIQVTFNIFGSFDCSSNQILFIYLNNQLMGSVDVFANNNTNCSMCRNCWAETSPLVVTSKDYPGGVPSYNTDYYNSVSLAFPDYFSPNDIHFCVSKITLHLTYNETSQVSDSSSSDNNGFTVPVWFWSLVAAAGVTVLVLVFTLVMLWRRSRAPSNSGRGSKGSWGKYRSLSTTEYIHPRQLEDINIDFNEFIVDVQIGRGSFGLVHKGLWRGTEVAIKRLPSETMDEQTLLEFMKEAFIMRQLRHPNVLQVLGVSSQPPCIIMEYMPRGSLFQLIHNHSVTLDWPIVRKLAIEICRGMAYLHGCNPPLIHRDLKPHNLLVDDTWRVKVCDFGLSRFWEAKKHMTACGTPAYAAPEVLRNSTYSVSADVYSFAMVMWELITRQTLYPGIPPFQIIFTVGSQGMRPTLPTACHPNLARIIRECWAEDPSSRPSFVNLAERIAELPDMWSLPS